MRAQTLQKEFLEGKRIIYLAYRLFNFADKIDAMGLEEAIVNGVKDAFRELDVPMPFYPVFFPYRDTLQHSDVGAMTWEDVYNGDANRLKNLFACVGLTYGPSFADGTVSELGYAIGYGVPTLAVINDALVYHNIEDTRRLQYLIDPLLDTYLGKIINNAQLHKEVFVPELFKDLDIAGEARKTVRSYQFISSLRERFKDRVTGLISRSNQHVREVMKDVTLRPDAYVKPGLENDAEPGNSIHLEIGGGKYSWQRNLARDLAEKIGSMKYVVTTSKRFVPDIFNDSVEALAKRDMSNVLQSNMLVASCDEANVPPGTAFLIGFSRVRGKKVVLLYTGNECWSEPPTLGPIVRNPLISYSADKIVRNAEELPNAIESLMN